MGALVPKSDLWRAVPKIAVSWLYGIIRPKRRSLQERTSPSRLDDAMVLVRVAYLTALAKRVMILYVYSGKARKSRYRLPRMQFFFLWSLLLCNSARTYLLKVFTTVVLDIVSIFSIYQNIDVSLYRNIGRVLSFIPWHPRVFYADNERKLRRIKYRNRSFDVSNFRYIDMSAVFAIRWHPRVFYANNELKLRRIKYQLSMYRNIECVLPTVPWHLRVFYAATERKP